jgi:hypothetical protein
MRDTVFLTRRRSDDKHFVIETMTKVGSSQMLDTPTGDAKPAASQSRDLAVVTAAIAATAHAAGRPTTDHAPVSAAELLNALVLLRWAQTELASLEPTLIAAARATGISWQALAPALGVASRQAAERRYLRGASGTGQPGATRDARVQAERDRRAAHRAVAQWANDNTADLRDADASALPGLLAATQPHLPRHPDLTAQIDTVTAHTDQILRQPPHPAAATPPEATPPERPTDQSNYRSSSSTTGAALMDEFDVPPTSPPS